MRACQDFLLTRRRAFGLAGGFFAWANAPQLSSAANTRDRRFVVVVLRGALDGLSAVAPVGDPRYVPLRERIALSLDGPTPAIRLDGFFALHPAMPNLARLYNARQATFVHAVATGYRGRSHFEGQDVLESGRQGPGLVRDGWLNRLIGALPAGQRIETKSASLLGVGYTPPLIVRGTAPILGWAPTRLTPPIDDTAERLAELYRERDPQLAHVFSDSRESARTVGADIARRAGVSRVDQMSELARGAARLLAGEQGPRVAALVFDGWDTHANAGGASGPLANRLHGLDAAIAVFESELAASWRDTTLIVLTEFGRTAAINGTIGTDHGTATTAFLVGGSVKGGRILSDWPGLAQSQLLEGRDLRPTLDVRALAKGVLADIFSVSPKTLANEIFPGTEQMAPIRDLIV